MMQQIPFMKAIIGGGAAGIGAGIGQQIWSDENQRRYLVMVVVFLILLWFILLNR